MPSVRSTSCIGHSVHNMSCPSELIKLTPVVHLQSHFFCFDGFPVDWDWYDVIIASFSILPPHIHSDNSGRGQQSEVWTLTWLSIVRIDLNHPHPAHLLLSICLSVDYWTGTAAAWACHLPLSSVLHPSLPSWLGCDLIKANLGGRWGGVPDGSGCHQRPMSALYRGLSNMVKWPLLIHGHEKE